MKKRVQPKKIVTLVDGLKVTFYECELDDLDRNMRFINDAWQRRQKEPPPTGHAQKEAK